jgi:hypothetical protein
MRATAALPLFLLLGTAPALAQAPSDQPIGRYVIDLRGALPKFPSSDDIATNNGLTTANLPGWGLGFDVAAHVYPLRLRGVTFGVGVDLATGRGRSAPTENEDGTTTGTDVTGHFTAVSPQVSLNFGSAAGWSYLSAGVGFSTLWFETPDTDPEQQAPRRRTLNFGGGARWFLRDRLAFTFDVRFYIVNAVAAAEHVTAAPRTRMMVMSAGVSLR